MTAGFMRAKQLAEYLDCSVSFARRIGDASGAKVLYGKAAFYDAEKVKKYMEQNGKK